jgi:hypothetical protein
MSSTRLLRAWQIAAMPPAAMAFPIRHERRTRELERELAGLRGQLQSL